LIQLAAVGPAHFPLGGGRGLIGPGRRVPGTLELLHALNKDDTDKWLKAIGWTTDFLVSYIFCMMCVLGVLSNKRGCMIQFQSKPYNIG